MAAAWGFRNLGMISRCSGTTCRAFLSPDSDHILLQHPRPSRNGRCEGVCLASASGTSINWLTSSTRPKLTTSDWTSSAATPCSLHSTYWCEYTPFSLIFYESQFSCSSIRAFAFLVCLDLPSYGHTFHHHCHFCTLAPLLPIPRYTPPPSFPLTSSTLNLSPVHATSLPPSRTTH